MDKHAYEHSKLRILLSFSSCELPGLRCREKKKKVSGGMILSFLARFL